MLSVLFEKTTLFHWVKLREFFLEDETQFREKFIAGDNLTDKVIDCIGRKLKTVDSIYF